MTRPLAWCLGFTGSLTLYLGATTIAGFDWARHQRLMAESARTQGTVTALEPHNHGLARYEFEVGGKVYRSSENGIHPVKVGDKVTVFYLPGDPGFSTLMAPGAAFRSNIEGSVMMAAFAGVVLAWRVGK